jgi:hypothetical protein
METEAHRVIKVHKDSREQEEIGVLTVQEVHKVPLVHKDGKELLAKEVLMVTEVQ